MFAQSNFDEAKYLTLGVGAVNVAFTIVAVSIHYMIYKFSLLLLVITVISSKNPYFIVSIVYLLLAYIVLAVLFSPQDK